MLLGQFWRNAALFGVVRVLRCFGEHGELSSGTDFHFGASMPYGTGEGLFPIASFLPAAAWISSRLAPEI